MYELAFMEKNVSDRMIEDAFNEGFKVIRFWAFEPLKPEKLIDLCNTANKFSIYLIPVLADKWGYMQDYVVNDEWFATGYKNTYLPYAIKMVSALKDTPVILLWEVINEPESDSFDVFYNFIRDVATRIKKADENHLLSIGTIGGLGSKYGGELTRFSTKNFRKLYEIPFLDAVSVHDYSFDATIAERLDTL